MELKTKNILGHALIKSYLNGAVISKKLSVDRGKMLLSKVSTFFKGFEIELKMDGFFRSVSVKKSNYFLNFHFIFFFINLDLTMICSYVQRTFRIPLLNNSRK